MISTSKTGVLVYGELAKEPEFKRLQNGSYLMKLNIRYDSEKNEAGKWLGKFIDVNIWRVDVDLWDDMLHKGDCIIAGTAVGRVRTMKNDKGQYLEAAGPSTPVEITGLTAGQLDAADVTVYHAGTAIKDGRLVTNGGRVLGVTAVGDSLEAAIEKAYAACKPISFQDMHFRTDIGKV